MATLFVFFFGRNKEQNDDAIVHQYVCKHYLIIIY